MTISFITMEVYSEQKFFLDGKFLGTGVMDDKFIIIFFLVISFVVFSNILLMLPN